MAHVQTTVTTTYLDIPMGGNTGGALENVPNADGTVAANTAWQSAGGAAFVAGTSGYPGTLDAFGATNTQGTNKPVSGLRLISVSLTGDTGTAHTFDVNAFNSNYSKVYAVLSLINNSDIDESLLAANTTIAHEAGTVAYTTAGNTDVVLLTAIVG